MGGQPPHADRMASQQVPENRGRDESVRINGTPLAPQPRQAGQQSGMGFQHIPEHLCSGVALSPKLSGASTPLQEKPEMPKIPGRGNKRRAQEQTNGKVLDEDEKPVPFDVVRFEGRSSAGRVRIVVFHNGFRHVKAFPAGPPRPKPKIRIFAIEEEVLVKTSDLFQHGAPVECGGTAWKQHLLGHWKIFRPAAVAALLAASVGGNEHPRRVQPLLAKKTHLRCAHADIRARVERTHQRGCATASSFSVARYGARETFSPWLMAAPNPALRSFSMMRAPNAWPLRRTKPSPLLSTTTISNSRRVCRASDSTHSRSLASAARVGITTVTRESRKSQF